MKPTMTKANAGRAWRLGGALLLLLAGGCNAAQWANQQRNVTLAKPGMTASKVASTIGKPTYILYSDGVNAGWEEWVYPTGSVFLQRLVVKKILERPAGMAAPKARHDAAMDVIANTPEAKTMQDVDQILEQEKVGAHK